MKRIESNYSWKKGLFAYIKDHLCLTKGHLENPEGQAEVELP